MSLNATLDWMKVFAGGGDAGAILSALEAHFSGYLYILCKLQL
jgi:hypothetical protein